MTKAVWLDCDPGHDDAMAIILAGHSKKIDLLGISTVFGNQSLEKTTANALKIAYISGLESTIVVAGQNEPLFAERKAHCPEIHGETGLDGTAFPNIPTSPRDGNCTEIMRDAIMSHPTPVNLVLTGCCTNAAVLLKAFPEVKANIEKIVIMGGALGVGNTGPVAEFNIQNDPEAAKIVFDCGLDVTLVPLEVTHTVLVTPDIRDRIAEMKSEFSGLIIDLLDFFKATYKEVFGFTYPPLHDPITIAFLIEPDLFTAKRMRVDVECANPLTIGQTICDQFCLGEQSRLGLPVNVNVCTAVDVAAFWDMMLDALRSADAVSCLNTGTPKS